MACVLSSALVASYIDMEVDSNCQCGITKTSNNSYSIFILAFDGNVNCHGTTSTRAVKIRNSCSRLQESTESLNRLWTATCFWLCSANSCPTLGARCYVLLSQASRILVTTLHVSCCSRMLTIIIM